MAQVQPTHEIWVLGATGRIGRAVARDLAPREIRTVLVGRNRERLSELSASLGTRVATVVADGLGAIIDEITARRPAVVVNTVGPFSQTGVPIARACLPGGHYLDLANDLVAVPAILELHEEAVASQSTLVTGAGFGFVATEAVVAKLCEGRPSPRTVRVDAIPSVAIEAGPLGEAFAATITETIPQGSRRYENSRLAKAGVGSDVKHLALPDGETVATGSAPLGDLHAAWLVSGAPTVVAGSNGVPTNAGARAMMPVASALMSISSVRRFATRRLAGMSQKPKPRPREYSWGHAEVEWLDDSRKEGWLRAGDAMSYTAAVAADVAIRLLWGEAPAGAYTPTGALGPDIASSAGAEFVLG